MSRQTRHIYEFGPFRLDPEKPCLWRDGELVSLTPKAVETLVVLVQQSGKLVEREQLMNAIWPDTFVEDNNLNFNVSVLRKALGKNEDGEQYIKTFPRQGYRFSAQVREVTEEVPQLVVERGPRVGVLRADAAPSVVSQSPRDTAIQPPSVSATNRRLYAVVAVALVCALGAAAWMFWPRAQTQRPRRTELRQFALLPCFPSSR